MGWVSKRPKPKSASLKSCIFIGSSLKDLKRFPAKVQNRKAGKPGRITFKSVAA